MINRKSYVVAVAALLAIALLIPSKGPASPGEIIQVIDSAKVAEILELQQIVGSGDLGKQVTVSLIQNLKRMAPQVPEDVWLRVEAKIDPKELEMLVVPIYDKYLTIDDIRAMKAFYLSPAGKKLVQVMPLIMKESMEAGQKWGQELTVRVMKDLEALQQQPPPGSSTK